MSTPPVDRLHEALAPLRATRWTPSEQHAAAEARLRARWRRPAERAEARRPKRLAILLASLSGLAATGAAAAGAWYWIAHRYEFTIRQGDEILARPRILVPEGETASLLIQDENGDYVRVVIDSDGNVVSQSNVEGIEVEYERETQGE